VPLLPPEGWYRGNVHRLQSGVSVSLSEEAADHLKVGKRSQRSGLLYDGILAHLPLSPHCGHMSLISLVMVHVYRSTN
jgi:hypothetical protein